MEKKDIIFEIQDLKKHYPIQSGLLKKKTGCIKALDGISLTIYKGETIGIVGESGCGKSTFGKNMMMLETPTSGSLSYSLDGEMIDVTKLKGKELLRFRKKVQMVFQDPYSSLNPTKKIITSFDEPMKVHGMYSQKERQERICDCMNMVNLSPDYLYRYPHEFSGGQRQRICIARALCINPELVICDEPVSALDVSIQAQVLNLMKQIQKELGLTYVFIAHDLSVVQYMSNRIMVMYLGRVVETADSRRLYDNPLHPYTQALLSAVPVPSLNKEKQRIVLDGDVPSPINKPSGCPFHTRCSQCMEICKKELPPTVTTEEGHQVVCHLYQQKGK